jgi:hypothetical protein
MRLKMTCGLALVATLALPVLASAGVRTYKGPFDPQTMQSEVIEFHASIAHHRAKSVQRFHWANTAVTCNGNHTAVSGRIRLEMDVNRQGHFQGSGFAAAGPGSETKQKVRVTGDFNKSLHRVTGTFRLTQADPANCDTGLLHWHATPGPL